LGPNATTGISRGSGTYDDPYIIEGWDINASSANGIEISMTSASFLIRDSHIYGGMANTTSGILLDMAQNGNIENCTMIDNYRGIGCSFYCNNISILNNTYLSNMVAISVGDAANLIIDGNQMSGNHDGIRFSGSNSAISRNNITYANGTSISLWYATDVDASSNIVSKSNGGVEFGYSERINFSDNSVSGTERGVRIDHSTSITIMGNHFFSDGIYIDGDNALDFNSHSITSDNLVNGLPVYYYKNLSGLTVDNVVVGELLIANCSNARISNLTINNSFCGIEAAFSDGVILTNCTISNCSSGIALTYSDYGNVRYNRFFDNGLQGSLVALFSTSTVIENNFFSNNQIGPLSAYSTNISFSFNTMLSSGILLIGASEEEYNTHSISMDNLANGKPIYYLKNTKDVEIDNIALGELIIVNCTNIDVSNLHFNETDMSIEIAFSDNVNIEKCKLDGNVYGIFLMLTNGTTVKNCVLQNMSYGGISSRECSNLTVKRNSIVDNGYGIEAYMTVNVLITDNDIRDNWAGVSIGYGVTGSAFHNNFINNTNQGFGYPGFWDNGYPDGGNYWSDYAGSDFLSGPNQDITGSDGIGDTPYSVDWNSNDSFPLMKPLNLNNKPFASFIITSKVVNVNQPITVDASGSSDIEDDTSGLLVRWDWECNGTWTSWSIAKTAQHNYSTIGSYTIKMEIMDTDGFVNDTVHSIQVVNDWIPPVTVVQLNGIIGKNDWYVSAVNINCTGLDLVSGISFTEYRLNNGSWHLYSGQFTVAIDGKYVMDFYSEDNVGNQETIENVTFKIDCIAPISISNISGSRIAIITSDNTSGVNRTMYRIDGGNWQNYTGSFDVTTVGNRTIEYYSIDNAGNEEEIKTAYVDNGPEITGIPPELLLIALLIPIVVIILSLFYIRRKRKSDDGSPP
jgi:parallel beta-helix repeat protein